MVAAESKVSPWEKKKVCLKFKQLSPMTQGGDSWLLADFMGLH